MSSILYQNDSKDIFVVDIPTSIVEAQGLENSKKLASCKPQQDPWPSPEPKSEKARTNLPEVPAYDLAYQQLVQRAMQALQSIRIPQFCQPRWVHPAESEVRKRQRADDSESSDMVTVKPSKGTRTPLQLATDEHDKAIISGGEVSSRLVTNAGIGMHTLALRDGSKYYIPTTASFFLGDCGDSRRFYEAVQQLPKPANSGSKFKVVLMDPPWPNRSVSRGKGSGHAQYQVAESMWDLRQLLFEMDISPFLADDAIVAVWITNKPAARDLVLSEEDGLFSSWGVKLVEEWLWVKVTVRGQPVLPIDGVWRKPYEVLLVGKKCGRKERHCDEDVAHADRDGHDGVKRRVILAVPDMHSRKPCLKLLLQRIFHLPDGYKGLEVFARNLVSGWVSWGNDVLKFNDAALWRDLPEVDEKMPEQTSDEKVIQEE
ncbi:MT-A70-like protein [Elsinoe fawcettii]|nr:MT-A70-like protein [Elsinoe fawcettii]